MYVFKDFLAVNMDQVTDFQIKAGTATFKCDTCSHYIEFSFNDFETDYSDEGSRSVRYWFKDEMQAKIAFSHVIKCMQAKFPICELPEDGGIDDKT